MRRRNSEAGLVVFWVKLMQRSYPQLCVKLRTQLSDDRICDVLQNKMTSNTMFTILLGL